MCEYSSIDESVVTLCDSPQLVNGTPPRCRIWILGWMCNG